MEGQHLSSTLLRAMIDGVVHPHQSTLDHLADCDDCSDLWWQIKRQAKREKADQDVHEPKAA
jgi:hypothetical protein